MEPFALMLHRAARIRSEMFQQYERESRGNELGVVDFGGEGDFGRLEGVVGREGDVQEEDAARVRRVALRAKVDAVSL